MRICRENVKPTNILTDDRNKYTISKYTEILFLSQQKLI